MWEQGLCVSVANVDPAARADRDVAALLGEVYERDTNSLLIGRRDGAGIRIQHGSISREHVRLERRDGGVAIRNLSAHGTTAINGVSLVAGSEVLVDTSVTWIQIGAFLLRLTPVSRTERWETPVGPPERESTSLMTIELFGDPVRGEARLGKTVFHLAPMPLQLLATLAEKAGQVVPQSEILAVIAPEGGAPQLEPKVHHIRSAVAAVLGADPVALERARSSIRVLEPETSADDLRDAPEVARRLIRSYRGRGYSLFLPTEQVNIVRHRR